MKGGGRGKGADTTGYLSNVRVSVSLSNAVTEGDKIGSSMRVYARN